VEEIPYTWIAGLARGASSGTLREQELFQLIEQAGVLSGESGLASR